MNKIIINPIKPKKCLNIFIYDLPFFIKPNHYSVFKIAYMYT